MFSSLNSFKLVSPFNTLKNETVKELKVLLDMLKTSKCARYLCKLLIIGVRCHKNEITKNGVKMTRPSEHGRDYDKLYSLYYKLITYTIMSLNLPFFG